MTHQFTFYYFDFISFYQAFLNDLSWSFDIVKIGFSKPDCTEITIECEPRDLLYVGMRYFLERASS